jgi:inosine-uridine nucleoside N-ribohydrolase
MTIDVILDCDTGTDDAVAIMLAALAEPLKLLGVTTVNGNVPIELVTENTLRVLRHIGKSEIPVFEGAAHPLRRDDFPVPRDLNTTFEMHGRFLDLPPSESRASATDAFVYLISEAQRHATAGQPLVIVATGPLTNIARAVEADPAFVRNVPRLVIMGGAHAIGNATPSAEFNFWADPEAAAIVIGAGFSDVTLVPLDATHQAVVSLADCGELRALGTPAATATAGFVEQRIRAHDGSQPMSTLGTAPVHDALCVASLLDPTVIETRDLFVDVETEGTLTIGRSVIDMQHRTQREHNAHVAVAASALRFVDLLLAVFA